MIRESEYELYTLFLLLSVILFGDVLEEGVKLVSVLKKFVSNELFLIYGSVPLLLDYFSILDDQFGYIDEYVFVQMRNRLKEHNDFLIDYFKQIEVYALYEIYL